MKGKNMARCLLAVCLSLLLLVSCTADRTLDEIPKPGLVGEPELHVPTDHPSELTLSYNSKASEAEIHSAFETYCSKLGLHKSESPPVNREKTWCESDKQALGIAISPSEQDKALLQVRVFHNF